MSDKEIAMQLTLHALEKHNFILAGAPGGKYQSESERLEHVSMQLNTVYNAIYRNLQELKETPANAKPQ